MNNAVVFIFGAVVGGTAIYLLDQKRVKDIQKKADDEILSVKEAFKAMEKEKNKELSDKTMSNAPDEAAINAYSEYVKKTTAYSVDATNGGKNEEPNKEEAYIIKPDEFAEDPDMEIISLAYYAKNEKLAYISGGGGIVEHPEDLFDVELLNHFGEYEENMLYIRDPNDKIEYDIEYFDEFYKE